MSAPERKTFPSSTHPTTSAATAGPLSAADEALALSVVSGRTRKPGRRRLCNTCGLQFPANELIPDFDEDGHRVGFICESCY